MFIILEWCINQFLPNPQYWVLINKVIRMCSPVEMAEDGKSERKPGVRPASTAAPQPGSGLVVASKHGFFGDKMEITRAMSWLQVFVVSAENYK